MLYKNKGPVIVFRAGCCVSLHGVWGRVIWSGSPFSLVIHYILSTLYPTHSEDNDAIISLCEGAVCGCYVITIGSLICCRLTRGLPTKPKFSLGRAGLTLNVIAFLYNIQLVVFSYFPIFYPATA